MIILSNTLAQTLNPGQSLVFDKIVLKTGCGAERYRLGSPSARLSKNGIYDIAGKFNVSLTEAGVAELAIMASGEQIPETIMVSTPGAVNEVNTVSCETAFPSCGCCESITVQNVGDVPVVVDPNSILFVKRIA